MIWSPSWCLTWAMTSCFQNRRIKSLVWWLRLVVPTKLPYNASAITYSLPSYVGGI